MVHGVRHAEFEDYTSLQWSPDGKRLAYAAMKEGSHYVVLDGKRSEPYGSVWELTWSPDGRTLVYSAKIDQDHFYVLDGKRGEPFDSVRDFTFSPDGKTYAYAANEGTWMMVVGGRKGSEFASVGPPVFSPDGSTYGYSVITEDRAAIVVGPGSRSVHGPVPALQAAGAPAFSRDGSVWAYRALLPGKGNAAQVRFSRTTVNKGELRTVEEAGPIYDSVTDPVVNSDGTLVAYGAGKGSRMYLVVGEKTNLKFSMIDRITFGPDGKTVAFLAGQYGKQFVHAGSNRSEDFDEVVSGPVWSQDGKKVAFIARREGQLWSKILEVK
jgi:Tol biopolymer transport system component